MRECYPKRKKSGKLAENSGLRDVLGSSLESRASPG